MITNRCESYFKALEEPDDDPEFVLHPPAERQVFVVPPRDPWWIGPVKDALALFALFAATAWFVSPIVLFVLWWSK